MKITSILLLSMCLFVFSCEKNNIKKLPDCIQELIDSEEGDDLKTIQCQEVNGEFHYWLNTDARHADGNEDFVNDSCETLCSIFGNPDVFPLDCLRNYNYDTWEIIWERE